MNPAKYSDSDEDAFRRITRGLIAWRESSSKAMELILEAKERGIWKLKYKSFKEFLELECKITERWGYELLEAAKVVQGLNSVQPKSGKSLGFSHELTPKILAPVKGMEAEEKVEVLTNAKAKAGNKPISVKNVQDAKDEYEMQEPKEMQEPSEPEVVRDELGWPIPEDLVPLWNRRQILKDMMADLSRMKCEIARGQKEQDDLYAHIGSAATAEFDQVRWLVKHALPWVVCTECQGRPKLNAACQLCKSTGFLIERDVEILPTVKDVLKIRTKMLEAKK